MKTTNILIFFVVAAGLIMAGCSKNTIVDPSANSTQQAEVNAMQAQVAQSDSIADFLIADDVAIDDGDVRSDDIGGLEKTGNAITPIKWGRHIFWKQVKRTENIVFASDTTAIVSIVRIIPGELRIRVQVPDSIGGDSILHKPFTFRVERRVLFHRVARKMKADSNWRPISISMTYGKTTPDSINNSSITSVEIGGQVDTTVTNPLETWFRYAHGRRTDIPKFGVGDSIRIRVTVQSRDDSAEVVLLRHGDSVPLHPLRRTRMNVLSTTGTTGNYTRVYEKAFIPAHLQKHVSMARLNATVDVFSYNSLNDDRVSVSNEFWGFPYIVQNY